MLETSFFGKISLQKLWHCLVAIRKDSSETCILRNISSFRSRISARLFDQSGLNYHTQLILFWSIINHSFYLYSLMRERWEDKRINILQNSLCIKYRKNFLESKHWMKWYWWSVLFYMLLSLKCAYWLKCSEHVLSTGAIGFLIGDITVYKHCFFVIGICNKWNEIIFCYKNQCASDWHINISRRCQLE